MAPVVRTWLVAGFLSMGCLTHARALDAPGEPADLVVTDAKIYTADRSHTVAQAVAIRNGVIVLVGSTEEAQRSIGPATRVERLGGKLVLPGLFDSHIHPIGIVKEDVCNLNSTVKSLSELENFVKSCLARYRTAPGQWLNVHQWNYTDGNQPDPQHPTLLATLNKVSTTVLI